MSMKNSSDTIGNRTRDLPTVARCLNCLRHGVRPHLNTVYFLILLSHTMKSVLHAETASVCTENLVNPVRREWA